MVREADPAGPRAPVRRRWIWLAAIAAFVVWHAIFDITIDRGMHTYLDARAAYLRGQGPEVTIRQSMADARLLGAQRGLVGAAVVVALSLGVWRLRRGRTTS